MYFIKDDINICLCVSQSLQKYYTYRVIRFANAMVGVENYKMAIKWQHVHSIRKPPSKDLLTKTWN